MCCRFLELRVEWVMACSSLLDKGIGDALEWTGSMQMESVMG